MPGYRLDRLGHRVGIATDWRIAQRRGRAGIKHDWLGGHPRMDTEHGIGVAAEEVLVEVVVEVLCDRA